MIFLAAPRGRPHRHTMIEVFPIVFGLFVLAAIGLGIWSFLEARKRREDLAALAARLGMDFQRGNDYELARQYRFLDKLRSGGDRHALNVLSGEYRGERVLAFDFHYTTTSKDSEGRSSTTHHYFSFFILELPRAFPEITIAPEGFVSKIAQAFGYGDIDFESHEFSRSYVVRCADKRLAYDICNPRMIEHLLEHRGLCIEIEQTALALGFDSQLAPEDFVRNLDRLVEIRARLPEHLLAIAS